MVCFRSINNQEEIWRRTQNSVNTLKENVEMMQQRVLFYFDNK